MNIGLNAHLLSNRAGYRSAGIHGYIYNTLAALPGVINDENVHLTAMVGANNPLTLDGVTVQHAFTDTQRPSRRVLWEQLAQPWSLSRYDLYHAMAFVAPALPYSPPTVVTVYDLSFIHYPNVLPAARRAYLRTFTAHTARKAARVIAISESTARDVVEQFGVAPAQVDVAVPGVDTEQFRPLPEAEVRAFREKHDLPDVFWLFVGTLEPRKNLPTLLRAYAQLPRNARPPLVLAGGKGWDYEPVFDTISACGLADDVHLPGFVPAEDLPLWYNSATVFVYPSVFEGFGIPPLEAMACGTPVIVSNASSLPEVVAGTLGLLVPPDDVDAWTAALTQALDDSAWRTEASETGRAAAQRFTWTATAERTWASYQQALG
ncbi:MAG: glycosyltransferase family 1 protein [Chloroflexota bacterium]